MSKKIALFTVALFFVASGFMPRTGPHAEPNVMGPAIEPGGDDDQLLMGAAEPSGTPAMGLAIEPSGTTVAMGPLVEPSGTTAIGPNAEPSVTTVVMGPAAEPGGDDTQVLMGPAAEPNG